MRKARSTGLGRCHANEWSMSKENQDTESDSLLEDLFGDLPGKDERGNSTREVQYEKRAVKPILTCPVLIPIPVIRGLPIFRRRY